MKRFLFGLLLLVATGAVAQQKITSGGSALTQCRADNTALRADLDRLRKELDETRAKLESGDERKGDKEAVDAIRAVQSAAQSTSALEVRKFVTDARIKVDRLPNGPRRDALRTVVNAQSAGVETIIQGVRNTFLLQDEFDALVKGFPELSGRVKGEYIPARMKGQQAYYLYSARDAGIALLAVADERFAAIDQK